MPASSKAAIPYTIVVEVLSISLSSSACEKYTQHRHPRVLRSLKGCHRRFVFLLHAQLKQQVLLCNRIVPSDAWPAAAAALQPEVSV